MPGYKCQFFAVKMNKPDGIVTGVVLLVGRLLPAGLIAVTLHTYWSHSDEPALVVMLSLLIVMVIVEEVLNIVMVVVLVLLVLVSRTVTV